MRKIVNSIFILIFCAIFTYPLQGQSKPAVRDAELMKKDNYTFTLQHKMPCTAVKSQGRTGTCWSFSTVSFLESELIRTNKAVIDLSEMFVVRNIYPQKADLYVRYHGKHNLSEGSLGHDVIHVLRDVGMVPESAYSGLTKGAAKHDHSALAKAYTKYMEEVIDQRPFNPSWKLGADSILNAHLGSPPATFQYEGKSYTPRSFADDVLQLNAEDYLSFTSFTHHPFYDDFVLEVPDNFSMEEFENVPLSELMEILENAIRNGFTVEWDGDVSETGFSAKNGLAILPAKSWKEVDKETAFKDPQPQLKVTQELRQMEFDTYSMTDDHLMHIVGMGTDQLGQKYYLIKNSWGAKDLGFDGYLMASEAYLALNTISILVHKDAVPKKIQNKLDLD